MLGLLVLVGELLLVPDGLLVLGPSKGSTVQAFILVGLVHHLLDILCSCWCSTLSWTPVTVLALDVLG